MSARTTRKQPLWVVGITLFLAFLLPALDLPATQPTQITYQGVLSNPSGSPVPDATYSIKFTIYDAATLGTAVWTETQSVTTSGGYFSVQLGSINAITPSVFAGTRWLGIQVGTTAELTPRSQLVPVPYSHRAGVADDVADKSIGRDKIKDKAIGPDQLDSLAVGKTHIQGKAIGRGHIEDKAVGQDQLDSLSVGRGKLQSKAVGRNQLDDKAVGQAQIDSLAVGRNKIQTKAVGKDQLDDAVVDSTKIQDGTISFADIGQNGAHNGQVIKWDSVGGFWAAANDSIAGGGSITGVHGGLGLTGGGTSGNIVLDVDFGGNGSDTTAARADHHHDTQYVNEMQDSSITSGMIVDGVVAAVDLADGAVTTAKLDSNAVTTGKILDATISFDDIGQNGAHDGQVIKWDSVGGVWTASDVGGGEGWVISDNMLTTADEYGINRATSLLLGTNRETQTNFGVSSQAGFGANPEDGYATVSGGFENQARNRGSTVGGGLNNRAGRQTSMLDYTAQTIGGGENNEAEGQWSTVGGGINNHAMGRGTTIAGGGGETEGNFADGEYSTIGGGERNRTEAPWATVSGGRDNEAQGDWATVPGGFHNQATGAGSFAAGREAMAQHDGSFVWSSDPSAPSGTSSVTENQFVVRASGGIWLGMDGSPTSTPGRFIETSTGGYLSESGDWVNASDQTLKENFTAVDREELLDKIARLPITQWNYKTDDPAVRHIGPTAQDFYKLFGVGQNDESISTIDPSGIALAAIQALCERTRELENSNKEMEKLERQVAQLTRLLEMLLSERESVKTDANQ